MSVGIFHLRVLKLFELDNNFNQNQVVHTAWDPSCMKWSLTNLFVLLVVLKQTPEFHQWYFYPYLGNEFDMFCFQKVGEVLWWTKAWKYTTQCSICLAGFLYKSKRNLYLLLTSILLKTLIFTRYVVEILTSLFLEGYKVFQKLKVRSRLKIWAVPDFI